MTALSKFLACLLVLSAFTLSACRTSPPRLIPPTPPIVECEEGKTRDVQPWPYLAPGSPLTAEWAKAANAWANDTVGIVEEERKLRRAEHGCLGKLRDEGAIRGSGPD